MSPEVLVERVVARLPDAEIARARDEFHARTGPFEPGETFYEERIRAFLDWLCLERHDGAAMRRFLARHPELPAPSRALGVALLQSMRSLFRVAARPPSGEAVVECLLHGARFAVQGSELPASRLREGDVFDGRAVALDGVVFLAPGAIFHPHEAHEPLLGVLRDARAHGRCDASLLDPLLRMRMRFDRFHSIRAQHVYRFDSVDRMEILAAPWAGH